MNMCDRYSLSHVASLEMHSWVGFARFIVLAVVRCSAADTNLQLLDRVVSGARFLTVGVLECDMYVV